MSTSYFSKKTISSKIFKKNLIKKKLNLQLKNNIDKILEYKFYIFLIS